MTKRIAHILGLAITLLTAVVHTHSAHAQASEPTVRSSDAQPEGILISPVEPAPQVLPVSPVDSEPTRLQQPHHEDSTEEQKRLAPIRAGFIVNFAGFTRWPSTAFESDDAPLVITIVNDRALARQVASLTVNTRIVDRRVLVYFIQLTDDSDQEAKQKHANQLRSSHVAYLSITLSDQQIRTSLDILETRPILTISSKPHFAESGGMFGLVVREGRVAFDANITSINEAQLKVSSKVLRLARIVRDRDDRSGGED